MDEFFGWHHELNGHEFEQILENREGQGSLACCSPWGHKELDMTEQLYNDNDIPIFNVLRNLKSVFHSAL